MKLLLTFCTKTPNIFEVILLLPNANHQHFSEDPREHILLGVIEAIFDKKINLDLPEYLKLIIQ